MAEDYEGAVIAAVDIAGFSQITQKHGNPDADRVEALAFVRDAFCVSEILAQKYQVRLLRRSGTSLIVSAGPLSRGQPQIASQQQAEGVADAERLALFALELIENVRVWGVERWGPQLFDQLGAGVRVGISSGRASAGLVGALRFGYDVWSSSVMLANRLESHASLNTCCTSAEVRASLRRASTAYRFDEPGSRPMLVQGLGSLRTYTLVEYVPAAAEGARLSLSVATPSGINFGIATPTPAPYEEMMPTTLEALGPTQDARSEDDEDEEQSESEHEHEHEEAVAASQLLVPARPPMPPPSQPPHELGRRRQNLAALQHALPPQPPPKDDEREEVRAQARPQRRVVIE